MTLEQEKYLLATQEQILNTTINIHAESRATRELIMLMTKGSLKFPEGVTAESFWKDCFDRAFDELSQTSQTAISKEL